MSKSKKPSISRRTFGKKMAGAVASTGLVAALGSTTAAASPNATPENIETRFKTNVRKEDIEFMSGDSVAINSNGLLNALVQSSDFGLGKVVSNVTPVGLEAIYVDARGRVVITDAKFAASLKEKISLSAKKGDDTNYVCKNAYKCAGAVTLSSIKAAPK